MSVQATGVVANHADIGAAARNEFGDDNFAPCFGGVAVREDFVVDEVEAEGVGYE